MSGKPGNVKSNKQRGVQPLLKLFQVRISMDMFAYGPEQAILNVNDMLNNGPLCWANQEKMNVSVVELKTTAAQPPADPPPAPPAPPAKPEPDLKVHKDNPGGEKENKDA